MKRSDMNTLKSSLAVLAFIVTVVGCFVSQQWPFVERENGSWDISSPRVSFSDVTDADLLRAKKIGESSWYSGLHSNKLSVAIEHMATARLHTIADESLTILVEEKDLIAYYVGEWSNQGVCVAKFLGQHTNSLWTVKPSATGSLPPRVTGLFNLASATGAFSNSTSKARSIYLAGVEYFPFSRLQSRKDGDPIPGAKDMWLKASVYISDDCFIVCEVEVVDWNQNAGIRNAWVLAFHYNGEEIAWVASSDSPQEASFDNIPIYRDYCIDKDQNVRIYIASNGCEGRVALDKGVIGGLFKVVKSAKR